MKICFNSRSGYHRAWPELFLRIKKLDDSAEAVFVTLTDEETATVKSVIPDARVYQGDVFMRENWDSFSDEKLSFYEKKYNCAPVWKYIYSDRFLINENYEYNVKTAAGLFEFFERIYEKEKFDFYYDETVATLFTYIPYLICKTVGAVYFTQMIARGDDAKRHYIITDEFQHVWGFDNDYAKKDKTYSAEAEAWAESFLSSMENKGIVPEYMKLTGKKPRFSAKYLITPAIRLCEKHNVRYHNKYSYINYRTYRGSTFRVRSYFRYLKSGKYYQQPLEGDRYVLFPLHFQPEASTIVCAQKYEKQLYYIDSLAKSLPAGTKLYLKEHYAVLGHRDIQFYKQLSLYPNVRLIDPWADTRKLILGAEAVTTMTGTAGWEAMLLRRPVILGGRIFFENAPGVTQTQDVFGNYMSIMASYKKPERGEIIKYLCEYYSNLFPGCSNVLNGHYYDEENLNLIAKSFLHFMKAESALPDGR